MAVPKREKIILDPEIRTPEQDRWVELISRRGEVLEVYQMSSSPWLRAKIRRFSDNKIVRVYGYDQGRGWFKYS